MARPGTDCCSLAQLARLERKPLSRAVFFLRSSLTPWHDAEPWLPVYGTLIDAGCLALLWRFTRREGIRLFDLVGFERTRLVRDTLLGFALIPVSLVFILGGIYATGWLLYGTLTPPYLFGPLSLPAALYGVLVWPFIWRLTEQMTYNGYLVPRFQVLCRSTSLAIVFVAFAWSLQHAFMPLTLMRSLWGFACWRRCQTRSSKRFCICDFAGWFRSRLRTP